ncbi:MAG: hypothetical protein JKX96_00645 [Acinetobacter sp.]|nr:hypothetical protein [Acinetobacter sp.]
MSDSKMMPRVPTEAMIETGVKRALNTQISGYNTWPDYMRDLWRDMYDAAPDQPKPASAKEADKGIAGVDWEKAARAVVDAHSILIDARGSNTEWMQYYSLIDAMDALKAALKPTPSQPDVEVK